MKQTYLVRALVQETRSIRIWANSEKEAIEKTNQQLQEAGYETVAFRATLEKEDDHETKTD